MQIEPRPEHYLGALEMQRNNALNELANARAELAATQEALADTETKLTTAERALTEALARGSANV